MIDEFRTITKEKKWKHEAIRLLSTESFSQDFIKDFHTTWIVSGRHIRSQIEDDNLLVRLLRHMLPKYTGEDIRLYRGENLDRWEERSIGFCWTTSRDMASMFGSGLNAVGGGGVLLSCKCKADWIISPPNEHSNYLEEYEYTVDPSQISGINVLEVYDPA